MKDYLGKHQVSQEVMGEERDVDENLYCGVHEKERVRLGLAGLSNFSRLWGTGLCLIPDCGVIGQANSDPESESPIKEIVSMWFYI